MIKAKRAWAFSGAVFALMVLAAACDDGKQPKDCLEDQEGILVPVPCPPSVATSTPAPTILTTPIPTPSSTPSPTPPAPTPTPRPCESVPISVEGDALQFDKGTLTANAGCKVRLKFDNASTVFHHNWVLVKAETKDEVAQRGLLAGPGNDWIQPEDPSVIAHTRLVNPGESDEVEFTVPEAGTYQFVCTFPGHNFSMFGDFVVTP